MSIFWMEAGTKVRKGEGTINCFSGRGGYTVVIIRNNVFTCTDRAIRADTRRRYSDCMKVGIALHLALTMGFAVAGASVARAQVAASSARGNPADTSVPKNVDPKIHRLILRDGSYQVVNRWEIVHGGDRIRFISAERGGDWEELPINMVDWAATRAYVKDHSGASENAGQTEAAAIDEEENADRNRNLTVAPNLQLPDDTGIWVLDAFHDTPELVELEQGNINQKTGHNIQRSPLASNGSTKQNISMNERHAKAAMHEPLPIFYVSIDSEKQREPSADAVTIDTHGAGSIKGPESGSAATSRYVILHADVRKDFRFVGQVKLEPSVNVTETVSELLPGKAWMKVTPKQPLSTGDYVLMEVLSPKEVNLHVWDFRVDPGAGDNENAIVPLDRAKPER